MLFEIRTVGYRYPDGNLGLRDISWQLDPGDRWVVLGANGSGKSTLLRLLNGLLFSSEGETVYRGQNLTEHSFKDPHFTAQFRRSVGFVFQNADAQLFNSTVREELEYGPRQLGLNDQEVAERVESTLAFLGIQHLSDRPPFRLSGGEKRKVALASVLTINPDVILLDEPFLGLDPRSQKWLVQTVQELHEVGKTTVIASHDLETVRQVANRAVLLSESHEVLAIGDLATILANESLLSEANLI